MKHLLFFLFILSFNFANASCLACWEQRKVEIILTNGETLTGYVQWNDLWVEDSIKFPRSLLIHFKRMDENPLTKNSPDRIKLLLIERFIDVKNDSILPFFCTKEEWIHTVDYTKILSIKELENDEVVRDGAGDVPVLTKQEIDKLKTNPLLVVRIDHSVAETCLLSYDPAITREMLTPKMYQDYRELVAALNSKDVIAYTVSFD
jgi:hypothetical protein